MQNGLSDDYCLPPKVFWAGNIAKFYDTEYGVTCEFWTSTSDWFRGDTSSLPKAKIEHKKYSEREMKKKTKNIQTSDRRKQHTRSKKEGKMEKFITTYNYKKKINTTFTH